MKTSLHIPPPRFMTNWLPDLVTWVSRRVVISDYFLLSQDNLSTNYWKQGDKNLCKPSQGGCHLLSLSKGQRDMNKCKSEVPYIPRGNASHGYLNFSSCFQGSWCVLLCKGKKQLPTVLSYKPLSRISYGMWKPRLGTRPTFFYLKQKVDILYYNSIMPSANIWKSRRLDFL
jgi:hypothetical protein